MRTEQQKSVQYQRPPPFELALTSRIIFLSRAAAFPDTAFFFGDAADDDAACKGGGTVGEGRGTVLAPAVIVVAPPSCARVSLALRLRPPASLVPLLTSDSPCVS